VVVHYENHGQVTRVCHRVSALAKAHLVLFRLLAGPSAHTRLQSAHRLVNCDLIEVASLDIGRLCLMVVRHMDELRWATTLLHHLRRHDWHISMLLQSGIVGHPVSFTRWVRHDALGFRDGLECDTRWLGSTLTRFIL